MYKNIVNLFIFLFLFGCTPKINPNEYHPVIAPKAKILPTKTDINNKPNIIIFTKQKNIYETEAKEGLSNLLINSSYVNILSRQSNIKNEIKLAENAKATNSNLNQANFIIIEDITPKTYNEKYIPPQYYKDKKGNYHKIPGYYLYKACSGGYINIYNILPYTLTKSIYTSGCFTATTPKYKYIKNYVIINSIKQSIDNSKYQLYKFFTPKGYIFEIRKKEDEIIIHTTLGKNNGAKKYAKVNIYEKKLITIPFGNKKIIEEKKIGEGIISNIVNQNDSWVIIKETNQPVKIGDYIKMNYKFSFWSLF